MIRLLILLMVLMPSIAFGGAGSVRIYLNADIDDSYTLDANPDANYGSSTELHASQDEFDNVRRSVIRFKNISDYIPPNATITYAICSLYCDYIYGADSIKCYRIFKPWTVGGVTWNDWVNPDYEWATAGCDNADDGGSDNSGDGTGADRKATAEASAYCSSTGWKTWIISNALVQGWYDGTINEEGLIFIAKSEGTTDKGVYFRSEDYFGTTSDPRLYIRYTTPGVDRWARTDSTAFLAVCGEETGKELIEALQGVDYWDHNSAEQHIFQLDYDTSLLITKCRGRSNTAEDPTNASFYISNDTTSWGTANLADITGFQDRSTWFEATLSTFESGQYVQMLVILTEVGLGNQPIEWGSATPFTIFDVFQTIDNAYGWGDDEGQTQSITDQIVGAGFVVPENFTHDNDTAWIQLDSDYSETFDVRLAYYIRDADIDANAYTLIDTTYQRNIDMTNRDIYCQGRWEWFVPAMSGSATAGDTVVIMARADEGSGSHAIAICYVGQTTDITEFMIIDASAPYGSWPANFDYSDFSNLTAKDVSIWSTYSEAAAGPESQIIFISQNTQNTKGLFGDH